jgi:tetratricopeptide (TPR) repeat protein
MASRLMTSLREAPATVPALGAIVLFIVWAAGQAGYPVTHWGPGGLIILVLVALALGVVRLRISEVARTVQIAVGALAAYTALSYASILWAADAGVAWEGANRTLLYLLVFALFACWRRRGASGALLLGLWTLGLIGLAVFVVAHLDAASSAAVARLLPEGRLTYPSGYANANAAEWLMAFWPALLLARSEQLPWALRGVFAGGGVLLAEIALLSQSRGSLYATPVMLVLVFALLPGRRRTFALLVPVAGGIAAVAPSVLDVGDNLSNGGVVPATLHSALTASLIAAVVVGAIVAIGAAAEGRLVLGEGARRRVQKTVTSLAVLTLVAVLAGGLIAAGNPVTRVRHAWDTFTSERGYAANSSGGSRLTNGLGSNRYDFYRVALDEFNAHPILGIGADNYTEAYLAHGHGTETPHYPHSVELRTLTETGLLGVLIAIVGLGAALLACSRAIRTRGGAAADPLARAVAAAALAGFGYWVVHGSVDWFWEFAGLGAPAFALLGIACSLGEASALVEAEHAAAAEEGGSPQPARRRRRTRRRRRQLATRRAAIAAGVAGITLAAAASLALPWFSQLEIDSAAKIWTRAPLTAYARLADASSLDPLSDEADLVSGTIALRYEDLARAEHAFSQALGRSPDDVYATLVSGVIASAAGDDSRALALLERAIKLDPREQLAQEALSLVRKGGRISIASLNRAILRKAQQFT